MIPIAIIGAAKFYSTFVDILGTPRPSLPTLPHTDHLVALIGYWLAPYCAIALTEHYLFRRGSYSLAAYDVPNAWDTPRHPNLPSGFAAMCALGASVAIIVPCIQQVWYTGPIAAHGTGDIGMLMGFVVSLPVYALARAAELWYIRSRAARRESKGVEEGRGPSDMAPRARGAGDLFRLW